MSIINLFGDRYIADKPTTTGEEAAALIMRLQLSQPSQPDPLLHTDLIEFLTAKRQGQESNLGGQQQERQIKSLFKDRGVAVIKFKTNRDLLNNKILKTNAPYIDLFGHPARSEFLYCDDSRGISVRIESRYQESSGSVDQKVCFMLDSARHSYPEKNIWFVIGGKGARCGAIQYLKDGARKASAETGKEIRVINIAEINAAIKKLVERGIA